MACNTDTEEPKPVEIVKKPENLNKKTQENIVAILHFAEENKGELNDSVRFNMISVVKKWYDTKDSLRTWSDQKEWLAIADSLYSFIEKSELHGLFPADYHFASLKSIHHAVTTDSASMMDAALWARADVMFTDAFMQIVKHLKLEPVRKGQHYSSKGHGNYRFVLHNLASKGASAKIINAVTERTGAEVSSLPGIETCHQRVS